MLFSLTAALVACLPFVSAIPPIPIPPAEAAEFPILQVPLTASTATGSNAPNNGTGFFDQLIDHENPSLGTFKQKFWWSKDHFAGPGSPIVLFTPGEIAAAGYEGYLTTRTLTGVLAQNISGAVVMLEHRYYGESSPYAELTVKNLQYLTLANAIADMTNFAKTVRLPFDVDGKTNAPKAPWVLAGGSYSGALSAWTEVTSPGTFWAYHSSSAPVQAIYDYWQYFYPVQQGMPANCSKDVSLVINHIDTILTSNDTSSKDALKTQFGLPGLRDDDFAAALENGPWLWQSNSLSTGYSQFYQWCDFVENAVNISPSDDNGISTPPSDIIPPSANGVGLEKALSGYAAFIKQRFIPDYCSSFGYWTARDETACFDTYNATSPQFTDISVANTFNRQWNWMLCNEPFAYWQDGAPPTSSSDPKTQSIVSHLVTGSYWQRQCALFFPTETETTTNNTTISYTYRSAQNRTVTDTNALYGGWTTNTTSTTKRLVWVNGEFDPWRTSGVSSVFREGGEFLGDGDGGEKPVFLLESGVHCSDLRISNWDANPGIKAMGMRIVGRLAGWVEEFYRG